MAKKPKQDLVLRILQKLQREVAANRRETRTLAAQTRTRIDGLRSELRAETRSSIDKLRVETRTGFGELKAETRRLGKRIDRLEGSTIAGFKEVIRRFEGHRKFAVERLREQSQRLDTHDRRLDQQATDIRSILVRLEQLESA